jgi:hypothetical protein
MSLDVYLSEPQADGVYLYTGNITHNLATMADALGVYQHLWHPNAIGIITAAQLIEPLTLALTKLKINAQHYEQFNAKNGWGSKSHMQQFIERYLAACEEHPDAVVEAMG